MTSMTRNEEMTRAAARLIGRDVANYDWCPDVMGLVEKIEDEGEATGVYPAKVFAPLADPGDAFVVEATLLMNVNYQFNGTTARIGVNSSKRDAAHGAAYIASASLDDASGLLAARMYAVVQFAALMDLAQGR